MESLIELARYGLTGWSWPALVAVALGTTHITIAAVTMYLHRSQAHRAVQFHPVVAHFFRFWLWLNTGMVTQQWAAIHRKHHAKCETETDPHSPQVLGLQRVLWRGAELYKDEAKQRETIERYGHGCPDDWIERHLYSRHTVLGVSLLMVIDLLLFGVAGLAIWAVQTIWIPFYAAGVINGLAHYWGYRNYRCPDASRNILPWGILIGGEELHNNHHAHATSPKLSARWFEFDIGWFYISILRMLGLASHRPLPKPARLSKTPRVIDAETVTAVLSVRYELQARLSKALRRSEKLLRRQELQGLPSQQDLIDRARELRAEFEAIWAQRSLSVEKAVADLQAWCHQAEASGLKAYSEFVRRVQRLSMPGTLSQATPAA